MLKEERNSERFDDIGRFEAKELCAFPATLQNISKTGCRVRFQFPVTVDLDEDYDAKITFARVASEGSFQLLCHPQWVKEESGVTEIGFLILPSRDFARLAEYIRQLKIEQNDSNLEDEISDSSCLII